MIAMRRMLLIGASVLTWAVATPSRAQPPSDSNTNTKLDQPGFMIEKPKPRAPDVKAQPLAWPRLDPGAVLCRTEADLDRLGARHRGETVDGPIDCQIVKTATAISIVQRSGPGRAEVKTSNAVTGWTDAWLPEKGPVGSTSVSR